jgi:hypothetical protein
MDRATTWTPVRRTVTGPRPLLDGLPAQDAGQPRTRMEPTTSHVWPAWVETARRAASWWYPTRSGAGASAYTRSVGQSAG